MLYHRLFASSKFINIIYLETRVFYKFFDEDHVKSGLRFHRY